MKPTTFRPARLVRPMRASLAVLSFIVLVGGPMIGSRASNDNPATTSLKDASGVKIAPQELRAGPVRVKFADGELRYLYVGDKEIVRRIYFAVRNGNWATATPVFSKMSVHSKNHTFTIDLEATCSTEDVDYRWSGHITGGADGTIIYQAKGISGAAFRSNRIGICVLYGTPAVTGKPFETTAVPSDAKMPDVGVFPEFVSPQLVAGKFNTLRYSPGNDLTVGTTITGTRFDMEDQRTYGDSSFKAYAPLSYPYPEIPAHAAADETLTVSLLKVPNSPEVVPSNAVIIRVGKLLDDARIPKIAIDTAAANGGNFGSVNGQQQKLEGKTELTWSYSPSVHLEDNDVLMENLPVIADQVRSVHRFAPGAKIALNPIVLNIHYSGVGSDPRGAAEFGAAWSTSVVKQMALAGVSEGVFATGPGLGAKLQNELGAYSGHKIYDLDIKDDGPHPKRIDGFVVDENGKPGKAFVFNRSSDTVTVKSANGHGGEAMSVSFELPGYSAISLDLPGLVALPHASPDFH